MNNSTNEEMDIEEFFANLRRTASSRVVALLFQGNTTES